MDNVYSPIILKKLGEICEVFGVGADTVRHWAKMGAPIAIEGSGVRARYSTEVLALQKWRLERARRQANALAKMLDLS